MADLDKLLAGLDTLADPGFMGRVSSALSDVALSKIQRGFASSTSPDGAPWAPLKHRQGQPLRDTRALQNGLSTPKSVDVGGFSIGASVPYAGFHQHGAPGAKIPARPFLPLAGLPASWRDAFNRTVSKLLRGTLGL